MANKQWTIPNGAIVLLPVGGFSYVEVYERFEVVYFVFRTVDQEYTFLSIWPENGQWEWSPFMSFGRADDDFRRVGGGIRLLLASIIRDFWVMEERERAFAVVRRPLGRGTTRKDSAASTRVVYLPRIRYSGTADVKRCETELDHIERRPHYVRAHLRRAETSSDEQRMLAQMYGFDLPTGYTFVRSHQRGHLPRDVVYRSRSALQTLYTAEVITPTDEVRPRWFAFERDVKRLMERLGFEVQHTAASRSGDRGVDLYATKGSGLDVVNWIIQCKCFNPKRSVGVAVVRDLIGALAAYPDGTKGMIVTTSRFTMEAAKLAGTHNIRLIDGREFLSLGGQLPPE